jgi:putative hydrolase of the HAD superfamily
VCLVNHAGTIGHINAKNNSWEKTYVLLYDIHVISVVIFDFFDVIRTDMYKSWLSAHGYVREGKFLKASQRLDAGEITLVDFLQLLSLYSGEHVTLEKFDVNAQVNTEVLQIIIELRKNYRIALLSNSPSALIRDILHAHGLQKYFDEIFVSSEVGYIKPSAEIFEYALYKLGVEAARALFIDDNRHHIAGAKNIGLQVIHFLSADQLRKDLQAMGILLTPR